MLRQIATAQIHLKRVTTIAEIHTPFRTWETAPLFKAQMRKVKAGRKILIEQTQWAKRMVRMPTEICGTALANHCMAAGAWLTAQILMVMRSVPSVTALVTAINVTACHADTATVWYRHIYELIEINWLLHIATLVGFVSMESDKCLIKPRHLPSQLTF